MNTQQLFIAAYIAIPILTALVTYFLKNVLVRLEGLERKVENRISEEEARQILSDKVDPLKEDLNDIKNSIYRLFDLIMKR